MGPIFNNCPHNWVTDGSRYPILLFILWNFQILDNSRKEIIQNLSSFLIIFKNFGTCNKCYLFTGHNFIRQQWFKYFPTFFIIAYIFYTQILIIFSFTFSQKCNTQVPLFFIIDFIFLTRIFEKNIPQFVLTIIALDNDRLYHTSFLEGHDYLKFYFRKIKNFLKFHHIQHVSFVK